VHLPAARGWRADRPGDLVAGQPTGDLLGRPGPNVGYAVTLANRLRDKITLAPHESLDDALAVISEVGMKRAAAFGRAPTMADVEVASKLLGYQGEVDPEFAAWRTGALHGAEHEYDVRRALVDAVPEAVLRMPPQVPALVDEFRAGLRQSLTADGEAR
jgi:CBS domain-containing protein